MLSLPETQPEIYTQISDGFVYGQEVIQDMDWLSCDLVIEKTLMRSMKTTGGTTRRRGMDETKRGLWCLSQPVMCEINAAMQDYTGVGYETSEQHKDLSDTRIERDRDDITKLYNYLQEKCPYNYKADNTLRSLDTGVEADPSVNADKTKEISELILKSMDEASHRLCFQEECYYKELGKEGYNQSGK